MVVGDVQVTRRTSWPMGRRQKCQAGPMQGPGLNNISFSGFDFQPTEPTEISEAAGEGGSRKSCYGQQIPKLVNPED